MYYLYTMKPKLSPKIQMIHNRLLEEEGAGFIEYLLRECESGRDLTDVANSLGISSGTANYWLLKHGLTLQKKFVPIDTSVD